MRGRAAGGSLFSDAGAEVVELPAFINDGISRDVDDFWRIRFWRTYLGLSHGAKIAVLPCFADWVHPGSDMTGRRALETYETFGELQKSTAAVRRRTRPGRPGGGVPRRLADAVGLRRQRGDVAQRIHAAVQPVT